MTDKEQIICTEEICPYCDNTVELPPFKGIYKCPECKELIVCCSMCEEQSCNECKYTLLTQSKEQLSSKTQECEDLKLILQQSKDNNKSTMLLLAKKNEECEELKKEYEKLKNTWLKQSKENDGKNNYYNRLYFYYFADRNTSLEFCYFLYNGRDKKISIKLPTERDIR